MNEVFNRKVEAKLVKLKETETTLNRNMIEEMKSLEKEKKNLKELQEKFLKEKKAWRRQASTSSDNLLSSKDDLDHLYPDIPKNWGFLTLKRIKKK